MGLTCSTISPDLDRVQIIAWNKTCNNKYGDAFKIQVSPCSIRRLNLGYYLGFLPQPGSNSGIICNTELGRVDICCAVSTMAVFSAARKGHLQAMFHIFAYLKQDGRSKIDFDDSYFDVPVPSLPDWSDFYDIPMRKKKFLLMHQNRVVRRYKL